VNPVVIDTGVLVAGVFWRHEPHLCVQAWVSGLLTLAVSEAIFSEYERVLREVKAEQGFTTNLEPWLESIRKTALWVVPTSLTEPVCRDSKDDLMIEAALAAGARTIIARDADLTVLEKPFGIQILTPRAWLATLSRGDRRKLC
jgi:putative PIN family toxin of toxin-antitoxin system